MESIGVFTTGDHFGQVGRQREKERHEEKARLVGGIAKRTKSKTERQPVLSKTINLLRRAAIFYFSNLRHSFGLLAPLWKGEGLAHSLTRPKGSQPDIKAWQRKNAIHGAWTKMPSSRNEESGGFGKLLLNRPKSSIFPAFFFFLFFSMSFFPCLLAPNSAAHRNRAPRPLMDRFSLCIAIMRHAVSRSGGRRADRPTDGRTPTYLSCLDQNPFA